MRLRLLPSADMPVPLIYPVVIRFPGEILQTGILPIHTNHTKIQIY